MDVRSTSECQIRQNGIEMKCVSEVLVCDTVLQHVCLFVNLVSPVNKEWYLFSLVLSSQVSAAKRPASRSLCLKSRCVCVYVGVCVL